MYMTPRTLTGLLLLVAAVVLFFGHSSVRGASQTDASVVDRVAELEIQVGSLQERLARVERGLVPARAPGEKPLAAGKSSKDAWRSLSKGMTKSAVRELLGEPGKTRASGPFEYWSYSNNSGGTVTFYDETVYGWQEP